MVVACTCLQACSDTDLLPKKLTFCTSLNIVNLSVVMSLTRFK
jgi:hypothetical protein